MQDVVLTSILDTFYSEQVKDHRTDYSKTDAQNQFMLMHILIIALAIESYSMGATHCDLLRASLKITPAQFAEVFR